MSLQPTPNVYNSLNRRDIAEDRRIINQKIRRHLVSQKSKLGETGADISDDEFANDVNAGGAGGGVAGSTLLSDQYDYGGEEDMNQTYEAMKKSMYGMIGDNNNHVEASAAGRVGGVFASGVENDEETQALMMQSGVAAVRRNSISSMSRASDRRMSPMMMTTRPSLNAAGINPGVTCIPYASIDIPKSQELKKQITGILYILVSIAILISYFFFLESCKLVNYGH